MIRTVDVRVEFRPFRERPLGAAQTNHAEPCVGSFPFSGCVDTDDPISNNTSRLKLGPLASRGPSTCTNPSYRSAPFACAAACDCSGKEGVAISQKRTNGAMV